MNQLLSKKQLEKRFNVVIVGKRYVIDGPGPARYGYAKVQACKLTWLGVNLEAVRARLEADASQGEMEVWEFSMR